MFTLNQQISILKNDLSNLKINSEDFSGGIIEYTIYTISNLDSKADNLTTDISSLGGSIDNIISNDTSLSGSVDNVISNVSSLSGSLDNVINNVSSLNGSVDNVISNVSSLSGSVDIISGKVTSLSGSVDNVISNVSSLSGSLDNVINNVSSLQNQIDINTTDISGLQTNKQNTLIPGNNITIVGDTISSTSGGGGTTIDSTTDLSCNTLTTVGDITVGGIILAPNQISFRATRVGDYTINSNIKLPFNVIAHNIGGGYSNSTYEFTAPVNGTYFFHVSFFRDFKTSDNNGFSVDFILNNGSSTTMIQRVENVGFQVHNGSVVVLMNAGERVYTQRSAGRVLLVGQTQNQYVSFWGFLIG